MEQNRDGADNNWTWPTLTSAFLLRRLLAAAERQNDTPSDGRVHIIANVQTTTTPKNLLTHNTHARLFMHASIAKMKKINEKKHHLLESKLELLQVNVKLIKNIPFCSVGNIKNWHFRTLIRCSEHQISRGRQP